MSRTIFKICALVSGETGLSFRRARETVMRETPAAFATSRIVTGLGLPLCSVTPLPPGIFSTPMQLNHMLWHYQEKSRLKGVSGVH
ncbi:hypothetical protein [uncultured Roseibium sp.]|uniref:hypothetical protein n=1 Tax=uncultured Roseibium sp. TaxID=1936171 RepID=UPI00262DDC14|nr:hypothetical protein [uncultured Roseibium sp.]